MLPVATSVVVLGLIAAWPNAAAVAAAAKRDEVAIARVFANVAPERPVALVQAPGPDQRWFVVEQRGTVLAFANDPRVKRATVFVDIRDRVDHGPSEAGLLGIAFHPEFRHNGQVFLSYTRTGAPLVSTISRFVSRDGGRSLDPDSEQVVLTLDQPYGNHNGGQIGFGPDGFLYAGFGDGGAGGDPRGHGQNTATLLGTLLRIDVDRTPPYAIPPDNPFAAGGGRPEIYAWGLRNPWRWSFDRLTGELWLADVGQGQWEEVNRIDRGGNYGWNIREGAHCFGARTCGGAGLIDPVAEYSHALGCSITGGYVYRGRAVPALNGSYVYGDYCSGRIWGLSPGRQPRLLLKTDLAISSFGEGKDGEVYVLDHRRGGIYRLVSGTGDR